MYNERENRLFKEKNRYEREKLKKKTQKDDVRVKKY